MKISIVRPKCFNIYQQRMVIDLISQMPMHEIKLIGPRKNLIAKLKEMEPQIIFLLCGGREHHQIVEMFKGTNTITVSQLSDTNITLDGEPEVVIPLLADAIEQRKDFSEVPGITYRHTTGKAEPWDINKSFFTPRSAGRFLVSTSRGCKGQCSFCGERVRQGSLRFRNIPSIIEEIRQYNTLTGDSYFQFSDLSFDSNPSERMKEILKALIGTPIPFTWGANFRPDFHKVADAELMDLLYRSGCVRAFIGVESANGADLDFFNKRCSVEDAEKTIELFRNIDADVDIGFINFSPISTIGGLCENLMFLQKHHFGTFRRLKTKLNVAPGLPIKEKFIEFGLPWDGWSYPIKEPALEILSGDIDRIEKRLNAKAVELYSDISLREVKRMKRNAALDEDVEALEIIGKYEPIMADIISQESDRMCDWFLALMEGIAHIERIDHMEGIMELSDPFINDEHMKTVIKFFKCLEKSMNNELNQLYCSRQTKKEPSIHNRAST